MTTGIDRWILAGAEASETAPCGLATPIGFDPELNRYFRLPSISGRMPDYLYDESEIMSAVQMQTITLFTEVRPTLRVVAPSTVIFVSDAVRTEIDSQTDSTFMKASPSFNLRARRYVLMPPKPAAVLLNSVARSLLYRAREVLSGFLDSAQLPELDKAEKLLRHVQFAAIEKQERWQMHVISGLLWSHSAPHQFEQRFQLFVQSEFPDRPLEAFRTQVAVLAKSLPPPRARAGSEPPASNVDGDLTDPIANDLLDWIINRREWVATAEGDSARLQRAEESAAEAAIRHQVAAQAFDDLARYLLKKPEDAKLSKASDLRCLASEPATYLVNCRAIQINRRPPSVGVCVDALSFLSPEYKTKIPVALGPLGNALRSIIASGKDVSFGRL